MRPRSFVVPIKETTIGWRSRAIILRSDQPLSCTQANMIQQICRRLSTTIAPSTGLREKDLQILQDVINNFLSSMAMCLSYRATHMILSFDQSERKQSSNSHSQHCSCKLACALFLVTVKVCIPPKLHKALK